MDMDRVLKNMTRVHEPPIYATPKYTVVNKRPHFLLIVNNNKVKIK